MSLILVVDDTANIRTIAAAHIRGLGHDVVFAADGVEALVAMRNNRVDCVLMDIAMPNMNGIVACKLIRSNTSWRNVRMVAFTAHAQDEDEDVLITCGFDEIVHKPADGATIISALRLKKME